MAHIRFPLAIFGLVLVPTLVQCQSSHGGLGYTPPAPICKPFSCPAHHKAVGKPDYKIWSYGCKESGMNILSASSLNLNSKDPFANMQQKNVNKCCIERDICRQTCGMTSKMCHDNYHKCANKICKNDQNCQLSAMMADISSEPDDDELQNPPAKYDPEAAKCKSYLRGQNESCMCVPNGEAESAMWTKLKGFYGTHNPEKLNKKGEIKDAEEVKAKWQGKEAEMFMALATKYKDKAVEIRKKPERKPYVPPPRDDTRDPGFDDNVDPNWADDQGTQEPESAPPPKDAPALDADDEAFEKKTAELEEKKAQAKEKEDYDDAQKYKESLNRLRQDEMKRLKKKKAAAVAEEDYREAKRIKLRLQKVEF